MYSLAEMNSICYNIFTHLTVDGYLDTFQLESIMTSASMKILVNVVRLVNIIHSISVRHMRVELLGLRLCTRPALVHTAVFWGGCTNLYFTSHVWIFGVPCSHQALSIFCHFHFNHFSGVVVLHFGVHLHSSNE